MSLAAEARSLALTVVASGGYLHEMRVVGIKVLKNKLSQYVRLAAGGETVLVADRDQIVAELVPPGQHRAAQVADATLANIVRQGLLTPALVGPGPAPAGQPVAKLSELLAELSQDRGR